MSKDMPVCPICWPGNYIKENDLPSRLSAPAIRALLGAKITSLSKLATKTEGQIAVLHGIGPSTFPKLRTALKKKRLSFKKASKK